MKTICFVDYDMSVRGGVEQVTANLSSALADHYEVHVISLSMSEPLAYELDPRIFFSVMLEHPDRLRVMFSRLRQKLKAYFKENKIDVAIVQGNYPGFLTSQMRFLGRTKLVFCDHGALMTQWHQKDIVIIRLLASVFSHKTVVLTEQSRHDYIKKFCLPSKKVKCIYNWADLDRFHSDEYNSNSKRIISAGRFGPEKGFDLLIKSFAPVAKKHPDWHLDIYGDGEMMSTVCSMISEYNLENNVHLMGMQSDLFKHYKDYSMYVLPSYREGLPLVLLEAKSNRLPIISFDIQTGPREVVRDGIDGILIPPYDLDRMTDAICDLIENEKLRISMAEHSQENMNKFSKEEILSQWCQLIDEL